MKVLKTMFKEFFKTIIIICGISFVLSGWDAALNTFCFLMKVCWDILKLINQITIQINGDYLITNLFKTSITFAIVGILLELLCIKRGKFGKFFGKTAFWLVGYPVAFVLNQISKLIFRV